MVPMALIWWIYHFWAQFWPYFNFVDFRAYFGPFSHVNRVGRCHPVNLKTDLVEVEDKFVAISYPKTPQRIHFLWKFMPVQTNLLLTLFLDDPVCTTPQRCLLPRYWESSEKLKSCWRLGPSSCSLYATKLRPNNFSAVDLVTTYHVWQRNTLFKT